MAAVRAHEPLSEEKLRTVHAKLRKASYMSGGQDWAKNARRLFGQYDKDRSGLLTTRELRSALTSLGLQADTKQAMAILFDFDRNGDGKLDVHEFSRLLRQLRDQQGVRPTVAATGATTLRGAFRSFDLEGRGVNSTAEAATL